MRFYTSLYQNPPGRDRAALYLDIAQLEGKLVFYFYSAKAIVLTTT
jgi:hypothetical protein